MSLRDPKLMKVNDDTPPVDVPHICERTGCGHEMGLHWTEGQRKHVHCRVCPCPGALSPFTRSSDEKKVGVLELCGRNVGPVGDFCVKPPDHGDCAAEYDPAGLARNQLTEVTEAADLRAQRAIEDLMRERTELRATIARIREYAESRTTKEWGDHASASVVLGLLDGEIYLEDR